MNTIYNDHKGENRVGKIDVFLEISIDNYFAANKFQNEYRILFSDKKIKLNPQNEEELEVVNLENLDRLFFIQNESFKHKIQGIISLSTFYEALINEIGITELGSKYFNENLDKLSAISKWEIILKLVYNKGLNKDSLYYSTMVEIINIRNKLIHYKTKLKIDQNEIPNYFYLLKTCLFNIHSLIKDLKVLDKEKNIIHFNEIENKIGKLIK